MNSKKIKLSMAICLSLSTLTFMPHTVLAEQTTTEFSKTDTMDGKAMPFSPLKKAGVLDNTSRTYTFTKDSTFNKKFKGIDSKEANVTIHAPGVELTFDKVNNNMPIRAIKGSETTMGWREWKADKTETPIGNIDITAKKVTVTVDESSKPRDTFALAISSHRKDNTPAKVNIKGDVDFNVTNGYWKEPDKKASETVTGGIGAVNAGEVTIDGNAKIHVAIPNQGVRGTYYFVGHYFVNGIYAGLNYVGKNKGPTVHITGDVDIDGDGTGIQANSRSAITIDGGGRIATKGTMDFEHYAIVSEESTVSMNSKVDDTGNLIASNGHKVEILGNVGMFNREPVNGADNDTLTYGNTPTKVNLSLSTPDSLLKGRVINHYAEIERTHPAADKAKIRKATGMNFILENKATWNNINYGRPFKGFQGVGDFTGSKIKNLIGGATADTAGTILQNDPHPILVDSLSGAMKVMYAHRNQGTSDDDYTGGAFIVKEAKENSQVTLLTDSTDVNMKDRTSVEKVLTALSKKLKYEDATKHPQQLAGKVGIAEGLTSSSATLVEGTLTYTDDKIGSYVQGSLEKPVTMGIYETKVMKDERLARTAINRIWVNNFKNFHAPIRDKEFDVRMTHGELSVQDDVSTKYNEVEIAYGNRIQPRLDLVTSISYLNGSGKTVNKDTIYTGKVEGTYHLNDRNSIALAMGLGHMQHGFTSVNDFGVSTRGRYTTTALGTAIKYAHDTVYGGWHINSSILASVANIPGRTYKALKNDQPVTVTQKDFTSCILGAMLSASKEFNRVNVYGSIGVFREYNGTVGTSYMANDGGQKTTHHRGTYNWGHVDLGLAYQVSNAATMYIDYGQSFGHSNHASWNINSGIKFMI